MQRNTDKKQDEVCFGRYRSQTFMAKNKIITQLDMSQSRENNT